MSHKYYHQDTEKRKQYFDSQFLVNAQKSARNNQLTLNQFLSNIVDFETFKKILEISWSNDTSLLAYFEGMEDSELLEFFERQVIQNILNLDIESSIPKPRVPVQVRQEEKKTKQFFRGKIKGKLTFAYKDKVIVKGKKQVRYRDSKGRFVSVK